MSWSEGNLRWTVPFKSLNNTSCRIDIYQNGYTGTFVQSVPAADTPFFYEEDEDEDLLNNVLRYRTGYIRLIEEYESGSSTSLDDIFPSSAFDRYVEVYYGSDIVFNGFIQVQDFCREQVPVPRVVELPIISPLGLMDQRIFSNTRYLPPKAVTLGELLNFVMASPAIYDHVYLPKNYGATQNDSAVNLGMKISSLVVSPWNEDFHYSMNNYPALKVMKGESYGFLIEAICKAFGWICHDIPGSLVFTAFDYEGEYVYYDRGHVGESGYRHDANIPTTASDLTDFFTPADAEPTETTIMPDTGIEIKYEGENTDTVTFDHTYVPATGGVITMPSMASQDPDDVFSLCNLLPVPYTEEFGLNMGALSFDNNDNINYGQCPVAWNGQEGIMVSLNTPGSTHDLFKVRFYYRKRGSNYYRVAFDMIGRADGALGGLALNPDVDKGYLTTSLNLMNTEYVEATFSYVVNSSHPALNYHTLFFISNIKLIVYEDALPYSSYRYLPVGDSDKIPGNTEISSDIDMPISCYRLGSNLIGDDLRTDKVTEYPYLFLPRKEYSGWFKVTSQPSFPHARLFTFNNKNWRIIAMRFDIWNDEIKLTMQNSSTL